jgi:hypothetical protein
MGVESFEPLVVHQLLEVTYRYVTSVLEDAKVYSEHAQKREIDLSDVRLAVHMKTEQSFSSPPPRDYLMETARHKNSTPIPLVHEKFGLRLPPERYCLTAPNYNVKATQKLSKPKGPAVPLTATFRTSTQPIRTTVPQTSSGVGSDLQASSLFPMSPLLTSHQLSMGSGDTAKDSGITATMAQLGPSVQGGSSIPLIGSSPSVSSGVSTTEDILNMPSVLGQNNF